MGIMPSISILAAGGGVIAISAALLWCVSRQARLEQARAWRKITEKRRMTMPLIQVRLIEGVFSEQQKNRMIEKLTDAMVSIEGENLRGVTWVTIEDVRSGDWGIGGKALTTEAVKALALGKAAV
jgi:4-oxalocrotonate tautomerase